MKRAQNLVVVGRMDGSIVFPENTLVLYKNKVTRFERAFFHGQHVLILNDSTSPNDPPARKVEGTELNSDLVTRKDPDVVDPDFSAEGC